ncbi:MAG: molybdate ABC transporter substrate-binding protein [Proteobacteria bacterium]|nr:molybdate ABC transporter substrate-binding protein [Pseudomonadota bacterium]
MPWRRWIGGRIYLCAVAMLVVPGLAKSETIEILAAASTTEAVTALSAALHQEHGLAMRTTFAASSTLAKHIAAGAPAHLFLSADIAWLNYLAAHDLIAADGRVDLLGNQLVLLRRTGDAGARGLAELADLDMALGKERLIMGDPAHVPAGRYGRQALQHLGLWGALKQRAVFGASVRNALALLARGQGRFAIAYATDLRAHDSLRLSATFPKDSHAAIVYPLALIRERESAVARKAFRYLQGARAKTIFEQYGFTFLPNTR